MTYFLAALLTFAWIMSAAAMTVLGGTPFNFAASAWALATLLLTAVLLKDEDDLR